MSGARSSRGEHAPLPGLESEGQAGNSQPGSSRSYAALWVKSNFSFLEGASHPEELVEEAARLGLSALALTDRDGVYGVVRAHVKARELGLPLVVGAQVTVEESRLLLLVQDRAGHANLCRLLSAGRLRSEKGQSKVSWDEVCSHAGGLLALWGGEGSQILAPSLPDETASALCEAFGDRLYALLVRHLQAEDPSAEALLRERAARYGLPVVAAIEVLYATPARRELQDVLTCIRHGVSLPAAGRLLRANAEHALLSPEAFGARFADDPCAVARTGEVARRCTFSLADLRYRYPSEQLPDGSTTAHWLAQLTCDGARKRYQGEIPADVRKQLDRELALIEGLDYAGYFLTMHEIVEFCRDRNILCQGRGSAANSAVCYCLGITAIDPVRMGLLFERFISEERAEPPDIDLDIEHERREEVIQHVYEKYGRSHAAMVAVVITYRTRSAVRDVGKALGVPETELDRLTRLVSHHGALEVDALQHAGLEGGSALERHLLDRTRELLGFPRHLSIHPGGFLLGHEPVHDLVPIENGTMEDRTVIQWDKDDVEALGLFKVDLLGLGGLSHLHRCFDLLRAHKGIDLDMATVPADDPATFEMLCKGDTVGVFQVESRAQMAMLPRLRPRHYYDLVIEISLVRPGPITGGMVHPYLRRRSGAEEVVYPHECLRPVLERTLGVPLFQEQVMKLAVVGAGYTPGEADQLRRDMAAWKKAGRIQQHRERLVRGMEERGIAREFAEQVFRQIEGFGDYGFPEAHAASFALLAGVGAWLRCHHLEVFTCALLNSQPMGFYTPASIVEDARRHGVGILPVDVNASVWDCTLHPEGDGRFAIRLGLCMIKGLGARDGQQLETARAKAPFGAIEDVVWRSGLDEGAMTALASAGAFDSLGCSRREALWEVKGLARSHRPELSVDVQGERRPSFVPLSLFEAISWDYRHAGASSRGHPLGPLREALAARGLPDARTLSAMEDGRPVRYAGLVICRQRPGTASGVSFMTMEDETGFVNLVIWPKVFERFARLVKTEAFLGVTGELQVQEGIVHLVAARFWKPDVGPRPESAGSRDFR